MTGDSQPARFDYDDDVYRAGIDHTAGFDGCILREEFRDVHPQIADQIMLAASFPVLDVGCGRNALGRELDRRQVPWLGLDRSRDQLTHGFGPRVRGDAQRLPFRDGSFGTVAALYMLYFFDDPLLAIREAFRVLRPGGLFVACAPSRHNHPELSAHLPPKPPDTFDAENAEHLVGEVFHDVRLDPWDMKVFRLATEQQVWEYLVARQYDPGDSRAAAKSVRKPVWVRARGAVIWARKP